MKIISKMKLGFVLVLGLLSCQFIHAQSFSNSNLPIVLIDTDIDPNTGQPMEIPDDPKVLASMKIIRRPNGNRNYLTDKDSSAFLNYSGRISIEIRGSTSQSLPKKPYSLTTLKNDNVTNNNVSLLGMPSENDWVLNALAYDKSLMRDYLSYGLAREIGNYAARSVYCEVLVNGNYVGLYLFTEKLKIATGRINIAKMTNADLSLPNLSGGYVTKCDKTTGGDPVAWTMPTYLGTTVDFIHESPKPSEIRPEQSTYISDRFN